MSELASRERHDPLTDEKVTEIRDLARHPYYRVFGVDVVVGLLATIDALRERLAAAENERDARRERKVTCENLTAELAAMGERLAAAEAVVEVARELQATRFHAEMDDALVTWDALAPKEKQP